VALMGTGEVADLIEAGVEDTKTPSLSILLSK
jgi:hypothetical protein